MSHLRPDEKHKMSYCRRGRHAFGVSQDIGAGIGRQVCDVCGSVSIDLTKAESLTAPLVRVRRQFLGRNRQ